MALDPVKNFAYGTLVSGISDTDASLVISDSDASKFPNPNTDGPFNVTIYNYSDYFDPAEDPDVEIVRVTDAQSSGGNTTYTIARGQEGTTAKSHNTTDKTYRIILAPTKKMIEDIETKVLSGTDANKPTIYKKDRFYWATDTKKLYWDNGSSWVDVSALLNVDKVDGADLDTDGTLSANSDSKVPSQKAVKTYADTKLSKSTAGEVNALTEKTTLSDNDIILIEDSGDDWKKKKAKKNNFTPGVDNTTIEISSGVLRVKDGGISQAKLKTVTGEVSRQGSNWGIMTLPGGEYGFYPQIKTTSPATANASIALNVGTTSTSYVTVIELKCSSTNYAYANQRYITASGKDHWIFLLIAKIDLYDEQGRLTHRKGNLIASYQAPDHPCANQGGATELDILHPFGSYDPEKHEIVLVDNEILNTIKERINRRRSLLTIINEDCIIDDTKRPKYEPREIVKINEYPDEPIGQVKARIKTPQWAKIMIQPDEITLEQRIAEKLPDYILYKSLWVRR